MIDNLYTQRYCSLFNLGKGNYKFIEADARICKLPDHDVVVHLAAFTEPHANLDWQHNYDATHNVARRSERIIFPSTASVLIEPVPHTPYAGMKLREEDVVKKLVHRHTIFRLGNLFGPSPGMRFHTVVSKLCWQAAMRQPLTVWQTAINQRRPYLDLIDVCRAICFAIKGEHCGTYNLVTQTATVSDVVNYIKWRAPVELDVINRPGATDLSQDIYAAELEGLGFKFVGNLHRGVDATMDQLGA